MRPPPLGAVLSVSVDLPPVAIGSGGESDSQNAGTAERILALLNAAALPATWFADEPASDRTLGLALAAGIGHHAGLRVDGDWADISSAASSNGRRRVVAEVLGRAARARGAGMSIATLALRDTNSVPAELLVKHGFTAIRSIALDGGAGRRTAAAGPAPLRYGLWQLPADFVLCGGNWFAEWRAASRVRRAIDGCIRNQSMLHLVIDAAAIAANSGAVKRRPANSRTAKLRTVRLGSLPAILRHIERRRSAGLLQASTIAEVVSRLSAPAPPRASASILRAA